MAAASPPDDEDRVADPPGRPEPGHGDSRRGVRAALQWQPTIAALIASFAAVVAALIGAHTGDQGTPSRPPARPEVMPEWKFTTDGATCNALGWVIDPAPGFEVRMFSAAVPQPSRAAEIGQDGRWSVSWPCSGHAQQEEWEPQLRDTGRGFAPPSS